MMIKFDTHVHTSEVSDCAHVPAARMVEYYHEARYGGIVITDHFYQDKFKPSRKKPWEAQVDAFMRGYHIAKETGERLNIRVLFGMEIKFNRRIGDYLVFGLTREIMLSAAEMMQMPLPDFRKEADKIGLLIVQAHPYRAGGHQPADAEYLHGVEVFNGNPRHRNNNEGALAYAKAHNLIMVSGSDAHEPEDVARGGMLLPELGTESELVEYLLANTPELITG